jgi:hypothetical protein
MIRLLNMHSGGCSLKKAFLDVSTNQFIFDVELG